MCARVSRHSRSRLVRGETPAYRPRTPAEEGTTVINTGGRHAVGRIRVSPSTGHARTSAALVTTTRNAPPTPPWDMDRRGTAAVAIVAFSAMAAAAYGQRVRDAGSGSGFIYRTDGQNPPVFIKLGEGKNDHFDAMLEG